MATSAFKSTTKRAPIGNDKNDRPSASAHRRSRSLSRFSRPIPSNFSDDAPVPSRGRSVSRQDSESNSNSKSYSGGAKGNSDGNNSRRRRSVSVVRYQISDSEVKIKKYGFF